MRNLNKPVLFLDFDGPLHPDAVYRTKWGILLQAEGQLFQWAPLLQESLASVPHTQVVLSTTWARIFGFARARNYLPAAVAARTVGATWHRRFAQEDGWDREWLHLSRYAQIQHYLARRGVQHWVALDNDAEGWHPLQRERLVLTDSMKGLGEQGKVEELTQALVLNEKRWLAQEMASRN